MKKLKSKLKAKLASSRGESLGEVLIALLIAALALTMLAAVISSTSRILLKSRDKIETYYQENDKLAAQDKTSPSTPTMELEVVLKSAAVADKEYEVFLTSDAPATVMYFVNDKLGSGKKVISYCLQPTGG